MKLVSRVVCLVALALLLSSVPAHAAEWTPLGQRTVDYRVTSVSIQVPPGVGALNKLRLDVAQNALQVGTVTVMFADGQTLSLDLNEFVGAGHSRVIDLPSAQEVQKVDLTYRKAALTELSRPTLVKLLGSV